MSYNLFEIPSESNHHVDIVWADPENSDRNAYNHYSYTIETTDRESEVLEKRGIRFRNFRNWQLIKQRNPDILTQLKKNQGYYVGESVLSQNFIDHHSQVKTVLKLGALELLANLYSGRITASDKDPFPHQLALQQYLKNHESGIKRVLIADEVGLGKTIEIGLILRDKLITQGLENFSCLYLTSGGLTEDVKIKLRSVIKDQDDSLITVVNSFRDYGDPISQKGIRIASMHAARRYLSPKDKKDLAKGVKPNIVIIDECHHCASNGNLNGKSLKDFNDTTQAYIAAHQIITGKYWLDSEAPDLVILMSATPFRSANQFTNLLRLLAHQTVLKNAFDKDIEQKQLLEAISQENSQVAIVWRQQDEIRNWQDKRLFPQLTIIRPHREGETRLEKTDEEYLSTLETIKKTVQKIYRNHGDSFGGFATAHLETRLTSSSLAGACWLFRWCVRHHSKWQSEKAYKSDNSPDTENLRELIRQISKNLSQFDEDRESDYAKEVSFPSDGNFSFKASNLKDGSIPAIYEFQKRLLENVNPREKADKNDDDIEIDSDLQASAEEILILTELGLDLLKSGRSVENAKLNWLGEMLKAHPDSRFLVFTEVLQTTAIIKATFMKESLALTGSLNTDERAEIVKKFYDRNRNYRILVATSAADEGLDFQIANKVVHWDISPDPAILMQRNGRVARLGQISDVTAYYLILEGTLAEKRDSALWERLADAGVNDPRMQLKILGQLDNKQQEKITEAIQNGKVDTNTVDKVLISARQHSEVMEMELKRLNEKLKPMEVLDRDKLLKRLKVWEKIDTTQYDFYKHKLTFEQKEWERPIFGEEKTEMESAISDVLVIQHFRNQKTRYNFDPEFGLFSQEKNINPLAGLLPWYIDNNAQRGDTKQFKPLIGVDPIGTLTESLARQKQADFMVISQTNFAQKFPDLKDYQYIVFIAHPLSELEHNNKLERAKYLTYYGFSEQFEQPININGASAIETNQMIMFLEEEIMKEINFTEFNLIEEAKKMGEKITNWVKNSFNLGDDLFAENTNYFVPIPVALIKIINDLPEQNINHNQDYNSY
ncbi:helicase-related protein [Geminocystis herdmanii]|uniref:helicase-related protein n=1 Tax=Geminocystis herdmanii TaxID=669359 RepID=UPI00034D7121|nr:helicase-related protein [Geminocystis herdmanii]